MNPNSISSTFSVQQVSKHHYLIRGDERIKDYMNFCDVKWSNTYQGWIVHEDDEVDLIQMHMEVLDLAKEQKAKSDKKKSTKTTTTHKPKTTKKKLIVSSDEESEDEQPKKKTAKKDDLYERFKRGDEISDDDDDEYVPSSDPSSETISDESEEDSDDEEEASEEEDEEDSEEEEEGETDPKRKKEFQFYKKGILAFGKMTERQQEKLEAIWNKTLRGWILRMSTLEKLKKMGWLEVGNEEPKKPKESKEPKEPIEVVQKPQVTKKPKEIEEKTFGEYMYALLVKGYLTPEQMEEIQGIYHPGLKGVLVGIINREKLVKMGFRDTKPKETKETKEKEVVKIQFTTGEQLKVE
jgi:hypothetical protein